MEVNVTKDIEIDIRKSKVYKYMGYGNGSKPTRRVASLIDEYVENAPSLIEPSYTYAVKDIELVQDSLVLAEDVALESKALADLLVHCQKVVMFLATIGGHLENMSRWLAESELVLEATSLDAIGSVAIQSVADFVQTQVKRVATSSNLVVSRRLSPGCCDWDISQQRAIFQAVCGSSVGVHLTDGCLMIPQKSVSGIIGLGKPDSGADGYNPCKICGNFNCWERGL